MTDRIRIFIGCAGNDEDLEFQSVLEYCLQRQASKPLEIIWMRLSRDPASFWFADPQRRLGWNTQGWATPFSALRWGIPAACNFQGRAIYLDIDMLPLADIAELWDQPMNGAAMLSKPEAICVTVYDCERMQKILPDIDKIKHLRGFYRQVRDNVRKAPGAIKRYAGDWNCLDMRRIPGEGEYASVSDPEIKLLHFTRIPTQPHLRYAIPRLAAQGKRHWYAGAASPHPRKDAAALFDQRMAEANKAGFWPEAYKTETPFGDYGR